MATITVGPAGRCTDLNDDNWHTIYESPAGCDSFRVENEEISEAMIEVLVAGLHATAQPAGESLNINSGKIVWRLSPLGIKKVQVRRSPSNANKTCKFNWGVAAIV